VLAVPFTSAVATIIDVIVLDHAPPPTTARRPSKARQMLSSTRSARTPS
jgi:hypothetical protein